MDSPRGMSDARRVSEIFVLAMGGLTMLLGIVVLTGWYTGTTSLIQVLPAFVPMQYNTALGFVLCGVGMLGVVAGRARVGAICGGIAGAIGALTLLEYVSGLRLGIDQLLMEHYITVGTSDPGRMAPNTALCFLLTGIGLWVGARATKRFLLLGGIGALVVVLGAIAFMGYLSGASTAYGWGPLTQMALHTSVGFIALGGGFLSLAVGRRTVPDADTLGSPASQRRRVVALSISAAVDANQSDTARRQQEQLEGVAGAALRQATGDYEELGALGESGELVLARRQGDQIVIVIRRQQNVGSSAAQLIPLDVDWAEPLRRALSGESGTLIGPDYRGEVVVAGSAPTRRRAGAGGA